MSNYDIFKRKRVLHFSDSDLDGVSARILGEYYLEPICEYIPINSNDRDMVDFDKELASTCDFVIFTDITPNSLEFFNEIKEFSEIYIFDHHQTGKDILGDLENYFFDPYKCGTKIFFDWLTDGQRKKLIIDDFVNVVNTYDLFITDSDRWIDAKSLSNTMYGYVNWAYKDFETDTERYNRFIKNTLKKFEESDNFYFSFYEKQLIDKANEKEKTSYKSAKKSLQYRVDGDNNNYIYFECPAKISLVSHTLLKENPNIDYAICYSTYDPNDLKFSIRSQGSFMCNFLAEKWGGGGHPKASAFKINDKEVFTGIREGKIHLI